MKVACDARKTAEGDNTVERKSNQAVSLSRRAGLGLGAAYYGMQFLPSTGFSPSYIVTLFQHMRCCIWNYM